MFIKVNLTNVSDTIFGILLSCTHKNSITVTCVSFNSTTRQTLRLVQIRSICRRQTKTQNLKLFLERVENIVEKEENAGFQHFPLFPPCFQQHPFPGS